MKNPFKSNLLKNYQTEIDLFLQSYSSIKGLSKSQQIELSKNTAIAERRDKAEPCVKD